MVNSIRNGIGFALLGLALLVSTGCNSLVNVGLVTPERAKYCDEIYHHPGPGNGFYYTGKGNFPTLIGLPNILFR